MTGENRLIQPLIKGYEWFAAGANLLQPLVLLIFRLYWGYQFFLTGKGKLINHKSVAEFFASLGIPAPELNAWFVGGLECFGGLLLLAGLCSRPIALMLAGAMTVAYLSVPEDRAKVLDIFNNPDAFLTADPFFFLLTSVLVLAFGPGVFSVDYFIGRFIFRRLATAPGAASQA